MIKGKDPFCLFFVLIPALLGSCDHSGAQTDSAAFDAMLQTLLSDEVPVVSVKKAAGMKDRYTFLDARSREEYRVSHIKEAQWVGYEEFDPKKLEGIPKTKPLVVYCSVGKRSETITKELRKAGYDRAMNLYGGIFEWVNQDHPVFRKPGRRTDSVHAFSSEWGIWLNKGEKVYPTE